MYYSTKHKKEDGPSNPDSESFETASPEKRASTQHGFAGVYHTSKLPKDGIPDDSHSELSCYPENTFPSMYYTTATRADGEEDCSSHGIDGFETTSPEKRASTQHGFAGVYHTSK